MELSIIIAASGVIITATSLFFNWRSRGQDMSDKKLATALQPIRDTLEQHRKYHSEHYETTGDLGAAVAELSQQMKDHEKRDDERFEGNRDMLREIRDDIKDIARRMYGDK